MRRTFRTISLHLKLTSVEAVPAPSRRHSSRASPACGWSSRLRSRAGASTCLLWHCAAWPDHCRVGLFVQGPAGGARSCTTLHAQEPCSTLFIRAIAPRAAKQASEKSAPGPATNLTDANPKAGGPLQANPISADHFTGNELWLTFMPFGSVPHVPKAPNSISLEHYNSIESSSKTLRTMARMSGASRVRQRRSNSSKSSPSSIPQYTLGHKANIFSSMPDAVPMAAIRIPSSGDKSLSVTR